MAYLLCILFLCLKMKLVFSINNIVDERDASIIFGGDISFSGIMKRKIDSGKCTYNTSFETIRKYLREADEVIVNLENPVAEKEKIDKLPKHKLKKIHLISDEESLSAMKFELT